jgi:hypothetical protein
MTIPSPTVVSAGVDALARANQPTAADVLLRALGQAANTPASNEEAATAVENLLSGLERLELVSTDAYFGDLVYARGFSGEELQDPYGNLVLDTVAKTLQDGLARDSINWNARTLFDESSMPIADWADTVFRSFTGIASEGPITSEDFWTYDESGNLASGITAQVYINENLTIAFTNGLLTEVNES